MQPDTIIDVVILGAGPAGLQAAIHAARRKATVMLFGKQVKSSLFHAHVENFCCLFSVSGEDMLQTGREQAVRFGAQICDEDIMQVNQEGALFDLVTESGSRIRCKSLIVATGSTRNKLGVPGEKELLGKGVSYCVECDANFFRSQDVAVIGEESAAAGGALTLLGYARKVYLVCKQLQVVPALREEVERSGVAVHSGVEVARIEGEKEVSGLLLKNGARLDVSGVFIELGAKGVMELATTLGIRLDDEGKYIQTDKKQRTSKAGVFAAGDICGPPWQMAKAVGEGCVAGLEAAGYAKKLKLA